ncbi:Putative transcriptional regulatory protein, HTH DNA binding domain [Dokdonella koreensis DS-123]|uniref:Transcriptional regulatory protein, HTH DNA binding domain n=2 Tax=Dokdonella TaxID=323413 RepID=A0A167G746_9GAMM|nr:Putative transcriptional regulatory protein, HTH DNA binding domain [Dokdonella koreensis DS-123]
MQHTAYSFSDFRIDLARRELDRAGELLAPSVKVFDCIAYLIEHRDRAVGRDELIAAVWGRAEVTYAMLGQLVIKARRILGGSGDDQDMIRTLPRFGYRWVGDVAEDTIVIESEAARTMRPPVSSPRPRFRNFERFRRVLPVLLVPMVAAVIALAVQHVRSPSTVRIPDPLVQASEAMAVLPIEVQADGSWSWVRLGVMDLIAERLRGAGQPVVPSENVVALVRDLAHAAEAVRDATGVRQVVVVNATLVETEWTVRLTLTSMQGTERTVEAHADEVTIAAQNAADKLLATLGRPVPQSPDELSSRPLAELLARARSALFNNELEAAQRILESAPTELQRSPELRRRLAQAEYRSGRLGAANERLEVLLDEIGTESHPRRRAGVLNDLGVIALYSDRPDLAKRRFNESLTLLANESDPVELGRAHTGRGIAYALGGDYDHAGAEFARARVAYGIVGDAVALATIEMNEAVLEIRYDRYAAAQPMLERAATRFEQLGSRHELFGANALKMRVELALLAPARAYAIGVHWLPHLGELQSPRVKRSFLLEWARTLAASGRMAEARMTFDALTQGSESDEDPSNFSFEVWSEHALFDFTEGRVDSASAMSKRAIERLTLPDDVPARALAWLTVVRALTGLGRDAEAASETQRFSEWARTSGVTIARLHATLAEAERADREGRREMARQSEETALREALQTGVPAYIAEVADSYAPRLLAWRELDRAVTVIGSVSRYAANDYRCALLVARLYHALGRHGDWQTALQQARALAGERAIPAEIVSPPTDNGPRIAGIVSPTH